MSRAIRSFSDELRKSVVLRRLKGQARGLGYWAARDAVNKHYKKDKKLSEVAEDLKVRT